jgi:hypothetical protein
MPDDRTADAQPADRREPRDAQSRDALLEEARTLRLWADHLESQLARKTKQVDTWRRRAEKREARIADFESRSLLRRWRAKRQPPASPNRHPRQSVERAKPAPPPQGRIVHPTVRVGVVSTQDDLPRLFHRMNTITISDENDSDAVSAADLLVLIGQEGYDLAMGWDKTRSWIEAGHPVLDLSGQLRGGGPPSEADLLFFDPVDDVFGIDLPESPKRPLLEPTLARIPHIDPDWSARILETVDPEATHVDQEQRVVSELRRLRSDKAPEAVCARMLTNAGFEVPAWRREALAILQSRRPDLVLDAVSRLTAQTYRPLRIAVGLHPPAWDAESAARSKLEPSGIPFEVVRFDGDLPQGSCLNALVTIPPGDVILKIDDDDLYSTVFVEDMMGALAYSGADIVGKACSFFQLRNGERVLIAGSKAYQNVEHVVGPTITATRSAWERVRFPARHQRVDSKFLQAARITGLSVVSHHPWDFCVVRHESRNTWTASDDYFTATGKPVDLSWEQMRTDG